MSPLLYMYLLRISAALVRLAIYLGLALGCCVIVASGLVCTRAHDVALTVGLSSPKPTLRSTTTFIHTMSDADQQAQQIEWIRQAINAATSELQARLETLTARLEDEHDRSDALQTRIDNISTSSTSPRTPRLKVDVPPFTGDRSTAEDFIRIASTALTLAGTTETPMQIAFVLAHLRGEVTLAWALGEQGKLVAGTHGTWEEFVGRFRTTWGDADATRMAGMKLQALKMNATADEYIAAFQVLADRTGYNDTALIDFFQRGLTTPLAKSIYTRPGGPPSDLTSWKEAASSIDRFERAWAQDSRVVKRTQPERHPSVTRYGPERNPNANSGTSSAGTLYTPMDIDANKRARRPLVCYACNEPGHRASECPNKARIRAAEITDALKAVLPMLLIEKEKVKEGFPSSQQ
jgi:hypothetical protein